MADCKDWLIISALMEQLRTINHENNYEITVKSVLIPKAEFELNDSDFPVILVYYNENSLNQEGFVQEQSTLDVILAYIDGLTDKNQQESWIQRYRNVGADIRKCIMSKVGLGGLCEYIHIIKAQPTLLSIAAGIIEAHITMLKIDRTQNMYDPYL